MIELAREQGVELPAYTEEGLKELVFKDAYASLEARRATAPLLVRTTVCGMTCECRCVRLARGVQEYLVGFKYTVAVLSNAVALERVAYEVWAQLERCSVL
jgi:hypothetical protein